MNALEIFKVMPTDETNKRFGIVVGNTIATTKTFESKTEAEQYVEEMPIHWEVLTQLVGAMIEHQIEEHDRMLNEKKK